MAKFTSKLRIEPARQAKKVVSSIAVAMVGTPMD
jgi:hypothetical protein